MRKKKKGAGLPSYPFFLRFAEGVSISAPRSAILQQLVSQVDTAATAFVALFNSGLQIPLVEPSALVASSPDGAPYETAGY